MRKNGFLEVLLSYYIIISFFIQWSDYTKENLFMVRLAKKQYRHSDGTAKNIS